MTATWPGSDWADSALGSLDAPKEDSKDDLPAPQQLNQRPSTVSGVSGDAGRSTQCFGFTAKEHHANLDKQLLMGSEQVARTASVKSLVDESFKPSRSSSSLHLAKEKLNQMQAMADGQ